MSLAYNTGKYVYVYYIYVCGVYVCICIYEQKFTMAEIMLFELKFNKSYKNVHWTVFKGR